MKIQEPLVRKVLSRRFPAIAALIKELHKIEPIEAPSSVRYLKYLWRIKDYYERKPEESIKSLEKMLQSQTYDLESHAKQINMAHKRKVSLRKMRKHLEEKEARVRNRKERLERINKWKNNHLKT